MGDVAMGKCEDRQRKSYIAQTNCKHSKEDMEDYHWVIFTHPMDFFQEHVGLKKSIPKHFFTSLLKDLSTKDLVTFGNFLSIEFMKLNKRLYATLSMQA